MLWGTPRPRSKPAEYPTLNARPPGGGGSELQAGEAGQEEARTQAQAGAAPRQWKNAAEAESPDGGKAEYCRKGRERTEDREYLPHGTARVQEIAAKGATGQRAVGGQQRRLTVQNGKPPPTRLPHRSRVEGENPDTPLGVTKP